MSKGWLGRDRFVPEFALFDTEEERRQVVGQFWRGRWGGWGLVLSGVLHFAAVFGLWGLLAVFAFPILGEWLQSRGFRYTRWVAEALPQLSLLVCMFVVGGISSYAFRRRLSRHCRRRLVAKGVPICIACGYDRRGQVDPRCPECGTAFDPNLIKCPSDPAAGPSD